MKKHLQLSTILLAIGAFLFAQEKTEVTISVVKDGKVVKDTTYTFDDAKKAKQAVHMMDMMASGKEDMKFHSADHKVMIKHDGDMKKHDKHMMFISKDGEKVEMLGEHSDHDVIWIEEDDEDDHKVIIKKLEDGNGKSGKKIIKKEIIMISEDEGEGGDWTIKEIKGEDGEVIVIKKKKGADGEEEINVEVIVKEEKEMKEKKKMVKKEEIQKDEKKKRIK